MSFDKDYPNRKDHRSQYYSKAERCDHTCRPGGSCGWCIANRTISKTKIEAIAKSEIENLDLSQEYEELEE
jgi:hypothetical protein